MGQVQSREGFGRAGRRALSSRAYLYGISNNHLAMTSLLTSINDTKLLRVRAPGKVVDRTLLVQSNAAVKVTSGAQEVKTGFSVVALVRIVNFGLCEDEDLRAEHVPLHLRAVGLEERLGARRSSAQCREVEDLDAGRSTL